MSDISNMFQIDNVSGSGSSLSKVLLIFYLIVASNFTDNLVSKQFKKFFQENRLGQHTIALLTLMVLVTSVGGVVSTRKAVIYSIIGYVWFLFTTKLDIQWNMVILLILLAGYLFENSLENREKLMQRDKILTDEDKKVLVNNDRRLKMYIVMAAMAVTVVGTFMYVDKKHVQYGGGYDPIRFLLY